MPPFSMAGIDVNKKRVLVADDDPIFTAMAETHLSNEGYEVITAADGAAAWNDLNNICVDLVVVDLTMPKIDGFRLIALIRSQPRLRDMPIIVVTVRDDDEALIEANRAGANLYITKPVNWDSLKKGIRTRLQTVSGQ